MLKLLLKITLLSAVFFGGYFPCKAQYNIPLDSVAKFTFITKGYLLSRDYLKVDVQPENGIWKSYHIESHTGSFNPTDDLNKRFWRDIQRTDLLALLNIIAKKDTNINTALFDLHPAVFTHVIDSLYPKLKPKQRAEFIAAVNRKKDVDTMLTHVMRYPLRWSDSDHSYILIITKANDTIEIATHIDYTPYHLPWNIGKTHSYNPDIARLYNKLIDSTDNGIKYEKRQSEWLAATIVRNIYREYFATRFNWEDLQTDYPASYKALGGTFKPVKITSMIGLTRDRKDPDYKQRTSFFRSSRLPSFAQIRGYFKVDDTAELHRVKRFEDTLARRLNQSNFLFNYLKTRPESQVVFDPAFMGDYGKAIFAQLATNFPEITNFDARQALFIRVAGGSDLESKWILLPDNTLLLLQAGYTEGEKPGNKKFMNLTSTLSGHLYQGYYGVSIHFSASGTIIADCGLVKDPYYVHSE